MISSILSDNRARTESFGSALTITHTAAVKTGTTEEYRDALTVGFTPSLVVGVWVGNNDNTPMDYVAGSLGAAPIWRLLMYNFLLNTEFETFQKPTFVIAQTVCINPSLTYIEYFIAGTQPESCDKPTPTLGKSPTPSQSPTPSPTNKPEEPTPTTTNSPTEIPSPTPEVTLTPTQSIPLPTIIITP